MSEPIIQAEHLSKRYTLGGARHDTLRDRLMQALRAPLRSWRGNVEPHPTDFWAVRDVSFEVGHGEVVGVIGRNGAGKSTLLKILSRITEPTTGRVRLRGRVASLLEVGTGFHPDLSGRDNIFLNGAILGMTRAEIEQKFDEIVAFAEIEQFLDTPVKRYSSGMYVRLAFAVAAHLEPEILIVDEVLAVGDAQFQKKCLGKMESVARGHGRTVLFVSHNMGAVRSLCHRCLWLDHGRVRAVGPAREITDEYLRTDGPASGHTFRFDTAARTGDLGQRLRLTELSFNGGAALLHGEPLTLELGFEVLAPVGEVSFGVGFASPEGVRLMTIESDLPGSRHNYTTPGAFHIRARIDTLHLQPGLYTLDLGARSGDFNSLDYLQGVATIEVLPGPRTPGTLIRGGGHVRYPSQWQ